MVIIDIKKTGKNIKKIMNDKNISVQELSDKLGFAHPTSVYKWIRGESLPSIDSLFILADILNCTTDEIIIVNKS